MILTQKQQIVVHSIFILCYSASSAIEPSDTISLITRAISGLFICFYLVGESLKFLLRKHLTFVNEKPWGAFSFNILLSLSYFMLFSVILSLRHALNTFNLCLATIPIIVISDLSALLSNSDLKTERKLPSYRSLWPIIPVLLFGFSIAIIFKSGFIWPSMPGWDTYSHLAVSNWIFVNHGAVNIMASGPSSFIPYPYLFHILIASTSFFIGVDPYAILWTGPFFTVPIYGLLVYGFSYLLTDKRGLSISASLIALTICGGGFFLGPQYLFPSTVSILLFLLLLITILGSQDGGRVTSMFIYIFILVFYSFYYYALIITFPILLFFLTEKENPQSQLRQNSKYIFFLSLVGMILLSVLGGTMLSSGLTFSLTQKLTMLREVYTDIFWFLALLGGFAVLFQLPKNEQNKLRHILAYTLSLLLIYFLPPSALGRTEIFFRSFLAIIASFSFLWVYHSFNLVNAKRYMIIGKYKIHPKRVPSFLSCVLLVLSLLFLMQPYLSMVSYAPYGSNISRDEYLAAEWIKQNSPPDAYILTDPSTGHVLRGLTLRNCSTSFIMKGQCISKKSNLTLLTSIYNFFREENPLKFTTYLDRLPQTPSLIVITTRTTAWLSWGNINSTFCGPYEKLLPFSGETKFSNPFFKSLKSWDTVEIYGWFEAKILPVWTDNTFSFSNGWSWYLVGAHRDYSLVTKNNITIITARANNSQNTWIGLQREAPPNCSDAIYLKIRYRIDVPCYALRILLWNSSWHHVGIHYLKQSNNWTEEIFTLSEKEASNVARIGIIIWTVDPFIHNLEIDYITLLKVESSMGND